METSFRLAEKADIDTILRLHVELNEFDGTQSHPDQARAALKALIGQEHLGNLWIICADGETVGYIVLTWGFSLEFGGRDATIDELYLEASYRNLGIGRHTLRFVESYCRLHDIRALHLEVDRDNEPARAVYKRVGFEDRSNYFLMSKRFD